MDCKAFNQSVDAYLDGTLEGAQQLAMQRHMADCPACRALYEQTREIMIGCAELGLQDCAPQGFVEQVMARVKAEPKAVPAKKRRYFGLKIAGSVAAGLLVVAVAGTALFGAGMMGAFSGATADSAPQAPAAMYATADTTAGGWGSYDNGASDGDVTADFAMPEAVPAPQEQLMASAAMGNSSGFTQRSTDSAEPDEQYVRKIIVNGEINLETAEFDTDLTAILKAVEQAGGYISSSSVSGQPISQTGSRYGRDAYYVVKIPADRYDSVLETARGAGKVTYYNEYTDDITSDYYDVQTRLETYQTQYEKVTALLEKCETMEDVLQIESHLTQLMYQIDSLKGQIRMWDQLVSFSTLTINLSEVADPSTIRTSDPTLADRIREGFFDSINGLIEGAQDLLVWLVSHFFGLLIWAVIAVACWLIVRSAVRKRRKKMQDGK